MPLAVSVLARCACLKSASAEGGPRGAPGFLMMYGPYLSTKFCHCGGDCLWTLKMGCQASSKIRSMSTKLDVYSLELGSPSVIRAGSMRGVIVGDIIEVPFGGGAKLLTDTGPQLLALPRGFLHLLLLHGFGNFFDVSNFWCVGKPWYSIFLNYRILDLLQKFDSVGSIAPKIVIVVVVVWP